MTREEILTAAQELAGGGVPFVFATVDHKGYPQVRWMGGLVLDEPFTVCMMTMPQARKMAQIRGNPRAQLIFHAPDFSRVATVTGACEIFDEAEAKQRLWQAIPMLARIVSGPEDPNFGVVKFTAEHIELLIMGQMPPQVEVVDL
jgi:general stress protein 26